MTTPADGDQALAAIVPSLHFSKDDVIRLDHRAYCANRRGDRCGWVLYCALASHLREVFWYDRLPWLRDDPLGAWWRSRGAR